LKISLDEPQEIIFINDWQRKNEAEQ
jgi:hypothetical protein